MLALYRSERQADAPGRAPSGAARAGRLRQAALRNQSLRFGGRLVVVVAVLDLHPSDGSAPLQTRARLRSAARVPRHDARGPSPTARCAIPAARRATGRYRIRLDALSRATLRDARGGRPASAIPCRRRTVALRGCARTARAPWRRGDRRDVDERQVRGGLPVWVRSGEMPGSLVAMPACVVERPGAERGGATVRSATRVEPEQASSCDPALVGRARGCRAVSRTAKAVEGAWDPGAGAEEPCGVLGVERADGRPGNWGEPCRPRRCGRREAMPAYDRRTREVVRAAERQLERVVVVLIGVQHNAPAGSCPRSRRHPAGVADLTAALQRRAACPR
jgi:hypothetical protein